MSKPQPEEVPLSVLVIAEDPLVRSSLAAIIADSHSMVVAGHLAGGSDLLEDLEVMGYPGADVALWDLGWDSTPFDRLAGVAEAAASLPLVLLVNTLEAGPRLLGAGAYAVLPRNAPPRQILTSLAAAAEKLVVLDRALLEGMLPHNLPADLASVEPLTSREVEVLQLLAEGYANRAIARRLHVSEHTVKFHVAAIMAKLHAQSRTDAVVRAARLGLVVL